MQTLLSGGRTLAYTLEGAANAPVVVLSNSLGTSMSMWDPQASVLAQRFRVLRYDTWGHGGSSLSQAAHDGTSSCTLDDLGSDVLALLDALDIKTASFCGISLGGLTGLWLGVHAGDRLNRLIVANSAAKIGTESGWLDRAAMVRSHGMDAVADGAASRWFTPAFCTTAPATVATLVEGLRNTDPAGYAACCMALAAADLRTALPRIHLPTLILAGRHDPVTTIDDANFIARQIPHTRCVALNASHLSNQEDEVAFNTEVLAFLG
jgi:3-oxoadipate enol-lactonase